MELGLRNKVAIIGGSSKGIGKGCAISLAKEGVKVVLCARNKQSLDQAAQEIETFGGEYLTLKVDMNSPTDNLKIIEKTIEKFGRIDILVNNSGGPKPGTFFDFNEQDWDEAYNNVLKYTIRMIELATPHMKKNNWGRIINITSLSVKEPAPSLILSNTFRTGIISISKSISKELIKNNITINSVCPGAFKTDRAIELMEKVANDTNKSVEEIEKKTLKIYLLEDIKKLMK